MAGGGHPEGCNITMTILLAVIAHSHAKDKLINWAPKAVWTATPRPPITRKPCWHRPHAVSKGPEPCHGTGETNPTYRIATEML